MVRPLKVAQGKFLLRPLNVVFGAPSHVALLRALSGAGRGLTGREVARAAGVAQRAAMEGLARLEGAGLVRRTPAGRAYLYELRRDHRLVRGGILPLLDLEAEIRTGVFARLRETFGKGVVSGCVFGSTARGEERPESDLDILLIVERKGEEDLLQKRASRLFEEFRRDLGIRPSLLVLTRGELTNRYRAADEFTKNVVREGETFAGKPIGTVIDD